jgi:hypothetical protein
MTAKASVSMIAVPYTTSSAERDLVGALQVAGAVRVTEADDLDRDLPLDAPADRGEVADDRLDVRVRRA